MVMQNHEEWSGPGPAVEASTKGNRLNTTRIRLRIPKNYHQEPVVSHLVSRHGLTINICAALLGANARDDGWFDLELRGTDPQIRSALAYLSDLDIEIWHGSKLEEDGW